MESGIDAALWTEDAAFAGGSYVIVQKYLHDLARSKQGIDVFTAWHPSDSTPSP
jgi:hypothetical protein